MVKTFYFFLIFSLLISCSTQKKVAILYGISNDTVSNIATKNWHLLDIQKDKIPGISWNRFINEFAITPQQEIIIAILDNPLDTTNKILQNYLWINEADPIDGIDNDHNGFIDDRIGWNFLGDTLGKTVLFNQFEYTRLAAQTKDQVINNDALSIDEELYTKSLDKYNSHLNLATTVVNQTPAMLKVLREQLKNPALPKNEEDITAELLDSLIQNNIVAKEDVELIARAKQFDLTLKTLAQDSLNYTRHIQYYLNLEHNDRATIANYNSNPDSLYHGSNAIDQNTDVLTHSIKTSGVIALALDKIQPHINTIKLMPVSISNYGDEHDLDIIAGIKYAVDNGAKVINMSSSKLFSAYSKDVREIIAYAAKNDVLFITSAGNDNLNLDDPANHDYPNDTNFISSEEVVSNFIKVGASNYFLDTNLKSSASNFGKEQVDLFAPGKHITTLYKEQVGGTSYAAPQTALVAALMFSTYPSLTAPEIKKILMDSSVKYDILIDIPTKDDPDQKLPFSELSKSGGILNAYNAMLMAEEYVKKKK